MNMNNNENMNQDKNLYNKLSKESFQISSELSKFLKKVPEKLIRNKIQTIQDKFNDMCDSWKTVSLTLQDEIKLSIDRSIKISKTFERVRTRSARSERKIQIQQEEIQNKENQMIKIHENIGKKLSNIKQLWGENLNDMKTSLKNQKGKKNEIGINIGKLDKELYEDLAEILNLALSERPRKSFDKELISHESAFSYITDPPESKENIKIFSMRSDHQNNSSLEFEECMAEMENQRPAVDNLANISIEKSIGGWKSEYESEGESFALINPNDIKHAINILKKANLLNSKGGNALDRLTNLLKSPDNTHKIELLLQLMNLQNKPRHNISQNSQKPPLKIPKLKKIREDDRDITPKPIFLFGEETEFNKTIVSSENPLSARQQEEPFDNILDELRNASFELKDVKLEDLLKIPYFVQDFKFESSDLITQENEEANSYRVLSSKPKQYLSSLSVLDPTQVKLPSPVKKRTNAAFDCQSTGISSQSGLRSRITLKTAGSETSQKIFTPGSKGIDESFKYL